MAAIITVTSPAADRNVVGLATLKTELGISGASSDAKLARLIAACGLVFAGENGINRPPWRQGYRVKLPAYGAAELVVPRWPLEASGLSVTLRGATVDAESYEVGGRWRDRLYRDAGWHWTAGLASPYALDPVAGSERLDYAVAGSAGWLMPDQASEWAAATAYAAGDFVKASDHAHGDLYFEATTAGTSGATEPTWPDEHSETVTDGAAVWTARDAAELPADIVEAALITLDAWWGGALKAPAGIQAESDEAGSVQYDFVRAREGGLILPAAARDILREYR